MEQYPLEEDLCFPEGAEESGSWGQLLPASSENLQVAFKNRVRPAGLAFGVQDAACGSSA